MNYATNLNRQLFSAEERSHSDVHVSGLCGKNKLDIVRVEMIKKSAFPLSPLEVESKAWQECIKAIDTANRTLCQKRKRENMP